MNDHKLDDLIIDNIDPKNSKTKSFLTIIALAIVVLIVAIIFTKIILKNPNENFAPEEQNVELISPELTLTHASDKETSKETSKDLSLKETQISQLTITDTLTHNNAKENITNHTNTHSSAPQTVQSASQREADKKEKERKAKELEKKRVEEERLHQAQEAQKKLEQKRLETERLQEQARLEKQKAEALKATNGYFIQVGSFSKTPSNRFLSVIKNGGFNYKITPPSSSGIKKLLIGPYASQAEAQSELPRVQDRINKSAFVIKK